MTLPSTAADSGAPAFWTACMTAEPTPALSLGMSTSAADAAVAVVLGLLFLPWRATAAPEPPAGAGPPLDARESAHDRVA